MKQASYQTAPLRLLAVTFDTYLQPWELTQFRGAMAHKVGLEHEWFHNHRNTKGGSDFHYRYPLIQYKLHKNQPMLFCIGKCVEEARHFFSQSDWSLRIGQQHHAMRLQDIRVQEFELGFVEQPITYRIHKWLALNQENYIKYQRLTSLAQKYAFLESILMSNILSFAEGVRWYIPQQVKLAITEQLGEPQYLNYKRTKRLTFNFHFECNIQLPDFIGLGKGISSGFGVVKKNRFQQHKTNYAKPSSKTANM